MRGSFKYYFSLLLLLCQLISPGTASYAQSRDSGVAAPVQVRLPDPEKLKAMQASPDFQYFDEVSPDETFWSRFMHKLKKWLNKLFYQGRTSGFWEFLIYAFMVATIVFVFIKMQKADFSTLFSKKNKTAEIPYDVVEENIHALNLNDLIETAITQREYRKAIRLHYLQTLKTLTDAGYIHWKPGKTNRSYLEEIRQPRVRQEFEQLTSMFEYVWYGGAALGADFFEEARQEFYRFDNLLKQRA